MVLDFVVVASAIHWPALKRLEVGPIFFAIESERNWYENNDTTHILLIITPAVLVSPELWERSLRACMDRYDGSRFVDESLNIDPWSELRNLAVVGSLSATAFPSLDEITLTFVSADEVTHFFFVWMAFVFYKKVAILEEEVQEGAPRRLSSFRIVDFQSCP